MAGSTSFSKTPSQTAGVQFGPQLLPRGVRFNLWAPDAEQVRLCLYQDGGDERLMEMERSADGWFTVEAEGVGHGQRYHFLVNDLRVPDPASRHQPSDVHGPSMVVDPSRYHWRNEKWRGRPWEEAVIYELHVGAFTPKGTFRAAIEKLDYLRDLGITAVELMPISDFPGKRNWGYDGVLHFAPDSVYGTPEDLKALVDAAHDRGLMIFLDVVYNHFGPEGNYLWVYAKKFFTEKYKTPWGAAIDFEGSSASTVREFFVENALYWLNDFRFDGLRFDAVHAIFDSSRKKFLEELSEAVRARVPQDRQVHLVLENDDNNSALLEHHFTAQWNDDFHHCAHVVATKETSGYYADYAASTSKAGAAEHFARVLAEGFAYQGDPSEYRSGEKRGMKSAHLRPTAFVSFMQNHDQIGNRAFGDRIAKLCATESLKAITAITLLSPQIPLLFMGEEWASTKPFCFFCDFGAELAPLVREGRRQEFAKFSEFRDEAKRELIPDPTAEQTYTQSILDWSEIDQSTHRDHLEFVRHLLNLRSREIAPRLRGTTCGGTWCNIAENAIEVKWQLDRSELILIANLSDGAVEPESITTKGREIFSLNKDGGVANRLEPWSVIWLMNDAK